MKDLTKIRVYEYAKGKDVQSKLIMNKLKDMGYEVKGHMSVLEDDMVNRLDRLFNPEPKSTPEVTKRAAGPRIKVDPNQKPQTDANKPMQQKDGQNAVNRGTGQDRKPQNPNRPSRPTMRQSAYSSDRPNQNYTPRPTGPSASNQPSRPLGQSSTTNREGQQNRPSQPTTHNREGHQNRPAQSTGQNREGQQGRPPYQNRDGQNRPQNNQNRPQSGQGQNRPPYQNREGGQNRPQSAGGQNRPYNNNNSNNRPTGNNQGQNRPATGQNTGQQNRNYAGNQAKPAGTGKPATTGGNTGSNAGFANKKNQRSAPRPYISKKAAQEKQRVESKAFRQPKEPTVRKIRELPEKITFTESLTVIELSKKLHREPSEIIKKLFMMGAAVTINSTLDKDAIEIICVDYGVEVEEIVVIDKTDLEAVIADEDASLNTYERPAVVTIMGHVDHGKTTLLDSIRKTKITEGEAGGITQHIGAYQVDVKDKKITFLDTPGHAAFTTMRARGAQVTDVTILVVAADDGVKPQTIEAINHAKAAEVPIIVAVNKMDKPEANIERVQTELSQFGVLAEAWGGDTIFVPISAKLGQGIEELLETIILVSEVAELKCNENRKAVGTVIEAQLDKGRGPVATLLVQNGTLRVGDPIVCGNAFGKVRAMVDDMGQRVQDALPSTPIEITGLNEVPQAGDRFVVFEDEKTARSVGEKRATNHLVANRNEKAKVTLDNLFEQLKDGEMKELNIILKADVQGSQEAVAASLHKIEVEGVRVKIIHSGVGAISESDVLLASSSGAIVIGFNVRPTVNANRIADAEKVDIRLHKIIYNVINEIETAMTGMLDPEFEEKVIGQAEVRQLVKISKVGIIAGSYVLDGKITRGCLVRVIRGGTVIHEGELDTLKRFKDDVKEVAAGYECGISLKSYNDIEELDVIEAFIMEEKKR